MVDNLCECSRAVLAFPVTLTYLGMVFWFCGLVAVEPDHLFIAFTCPLRLKKDVFIICY